MVAGSLVVSSNLHLLRRFMVNWRQGSSFFYQNIKPPCLKTRQDEHLTISTSTIVNSPGLEKSMFFSKKSIKSDFFD